MNKSESVLKWALAVFIIFGMLTAFFILGWTTVLKVSLIVIAIALIGCILLQSGRGGGLAAIGGLTDQSMMGTKTGSFLGNVTYLIGAALFVSVILLSKSSFNARLETSLPISVTAPHVEEHGQPPEGISTETEDASIGMSEVESSAGMQDVEESTNTKSDSDKSEKTEAGTDDK